MTPPAFDSIAVIVATRHRLKKLRRMLDSLAGQVSPVLMRVLVVSDADADTARMTRADPRVDLVELVEPHRGSVFCRNLLIQRVRTREAVLYATDDIEFRAGAVQAAASDMIHFYPDGDGVIGFLQENAAKFSIAGVALVGPKFLARYPGRQLFYPGYRHFACQEIERFGRAIGRIELCRRARLFHHHPSQFPDQADETHAEAREFRAADHALSMERRKKGIIWGRDPE